MADPQSNAFILLAQWFMSGAAAKSKGSGSNARLRYIGPESAD
jgi:hypothetical protein